MEVDQNIGQGEDVDARRDSGRSAAGRLSAAPARGVLAPGSAVREEESPSTFRSPCPCVRSSRRTSRTGDRGEILKELTPTILFTTEVDTARQRVQLKGDGAALGQADSTRGSTSS